jgi:hypothetical protein
MRALTGLAVIALAGLSTGAHAQAVGSSCHSRPMRGYLPTITESLNSDGTGASLCVQGGLAAVRLDVRQTTIASALSVFAAYQVSYRSFIQLDEQRDGTFQGSLSHVISRLLEGYNYVIKQENSKVEVIVFNKKGGQAVPNPTIAQASQERVPAQVARNR